MEGHITELERRYQALLGDYQAGRLDEAAFVLEVDKLQFNDEWGRYWMLGAKSGAWHYYDGQAWHQADPQDADKLPFMDDQGRYWQKGAKSGDWYYFHPESGEWVKPGEGDALSSPSMQAAQQAASAPVDAGDYAAAPGGAAQTSQFEQLYQDDEGRYWAMGAKSGQWYFYDEYGWHPAEQFQGGMGPQVQQPAYPPQPANYPPQPQPDYQAAHYYQQSYAAQPQQPAPAQYQSAPATPQPAAGGQALKEEAGPGYSTDSQPVPATETPVPPQGSGQSGTWYYHNGNQWLKYSTGEPADAPPPDPGLILEQEPGPSAKARTKSEPVVAEYFEDDDLPVEVVDVEVITVVEAEPDPQPKPEPEPEPEPVAKPEPAPAVSAYTAPPYDEVRPRRSRRSTEPVTPVTEQSPPPPAGPKQEPARRAPSDPVRPVTPRKKAAAHEPTIIIPTGATASGISSPASARVSRPPKQRTPSEQRRARDATMPMEPVPLPGSGSPSASAPRPVPTRHQQVTQSLPVAPRPTPAARTESNQVRTQRARQVTEEIPKTPRTPTPAPAPATKPVKPVETKKEGYTLGELFRSFPVTFWTIAAGIVVLVVFALFFIAVVAQIFPSGEGDTFGVGVAAVESPTPTLDAVIPDSTPTPGPTPTSAPDTVNSPTPASLAGFSSPTLGFTLDYPENWQIQENADQAIFSPSEAGLNPAAPADSNIRIGISSDNASGISELLADTLAQFPPSAEALNEGTISIASQTWTSTQISYDDENLGGQAIATLAVTNKDGVGYYLVAAAPADEWNTVQPLFQGMINSFRFGQTVALSTPVPTSEPITGATPAEDDEDTTAAGAESTPIATDTPQSQQPATAPNAAATPVVHVVKSGDTLIGIAIQYGVDVDLLASENGITDPGSLSLGQELTIPFTAEELDAFAAGNAGGAAQNPASSGGSGGSSGGATAGAASDETEAGAEPSTDEASAETEPAPEEETTEATEASPVSGKIAYPAFHPGRNSYDLWMVNAASSEQTAIAGDASQPAFNKDGSLLAYRSWDLGTRGIFFRDFVGGRGGKVTNFVEDGMPVWSPDSFTFAFSSRKEGDRVPRVYVGNQLGEEPFGLAFQGEYPSTFPDGRLAVKGCTPSGDCGIFTMGASGGGEKKISGEASDTAPAPSPDGSKVAFMSNGRGGNNWEIWVMNADGSNPKRLTENGSNDGLPAWSPDGQSIAYVSDQGGVWGIWVMNADGSNQRKLVDMKGSPDGIVLHDEPNSRGWLEERISWAP